MPRINIVFFISMSLSHRNSLNFLLFFSYRFPEQRGFPSVQGPFGLIKPLSSSVLQKLLREQLLRRSTSSSQMLLRSSEK